MFIALRMGYYVDAGWIPWPRNARAFDFRDCPDLENCFQRRLFRGLVFCLESVAFGAKPGR